MITWTASRDAELTRLFAQGLTYSDIARQFGDISRNACIGRARRIGLGSRETNIPPRNIPIRKPRPAELILRVIKEDLPPPDLTNAIPFADIGPRECKWLLNDGAPWMACGGPRHGFSPYCAHHQARAWSTSANVLAKQVAA